MASIYKYFRLLFLQCPNDRGLFLFINFCQSKIMNTKMTNVIDLESMNVCLMCLVSKKLLILSIVISCLLSVVQIADFLNAYIKHTQLSLKILQPHQIVHIYVTLFSKTFFTLYALFSFYYKINLLLNIKL